MPSYGVISVKTFKIKPQRMRMISPRYPGIAFSGFSSFSVASSPSGDSLPPSLRAREATSKLSFKIRCLVQRHHISYHAGAFLFSSKHPPWFYLSCKAGACYSSRAWDFTCLGEGRGLWQGFISVSTPRVQAFISVMTVPVSRAVAACCLSLVLGCHLHPCNNQLC